MKKIRTHPANVATLRRKLEPEEKRDQFGLTQMFSSVEVVADDRMDKDRPTGRYILPCGAVVDREQVNWHTRFIEYGPEDIDWLLYAGIIREEMEPLFIAFDDWALRFSAMTNFGAGVLDRRAIIGGFA